MRTDKTAQPLSPHDLIVKDRKQTVVIPLTRWMTQSVGIDFGDRLANTRPLTRIEKSADNGIAIIRKILALRCECHPSARLSSFQ